jgi:single-strand DNA-binding protein
MIKGLNKVMLIGFLERDPEIRYTPNGRPVASFTVATPRSWTTSEGERHEETEWFSVVAWGTLVEICQQRLAKGQNVYIEGRLQTRGWRDDDNKMHYRTEVVAQEVIALESYSDS